MSALEIIEKIMSALAGDEIIKNWCLQNFGREHKVYVDIDQKNPPVPAEDYPVIAVTDLRQVRGDSTREETWELELGAVVVQEDVARDGNTVVHTGFGQAETLREMAENAIYRARLGDVNSRGESGSVSLYPLFISGTTIPIKQLKSNRRAMPGIRS